jgi:hypothetical protein
MPNTKPGVGELKSCQPGTMQANDEEYEETNVGPFGLLRHASYDG